MDWDNFVMLPVFLFSATFYPAEPLPAGHPIAYHPGAATWHGVRAGARMGLTTGAFSVRDARASLYYVVMIAVGLVFTIRLPPLLFLH
jgi:lipooligosaccharide transport system permease protein